MTQSLLLSQAEPCAPLRDGAGRGGGSSASVPLAQDHDHGHVPKAFGLGGRKAAFSPCVALHLSTPLFPHLHEEKDDSECPEEGLWELLGLQVWDGYP